MSMKRTTDTFRFTEKASHPKNALALVYDLEGFSRFFNQPDVQDYVPVFLNHVSEAMGAYLYGGETPLGRTMDPLRTQIVHEKFTGDGALYIILPLAGQKDFDPTTLSAVCNRLWTLKNDFPEVVKRSLEHVPVVEVPRRIRFGLSRGSVYELSKPNTTATEYIGFCINLASRLQAYCNELGFIASARLMIPDGDLQKHGYRRVVATKIKGFSDELVIVDSAEYATLPEVIREEFFREPG
jgi:class 3 adenylate cyclase